MAIWVISSTAQIAVSVCKQWCPGWESNPHEEKSPEDFKSSASAIPPPGRWHYKSSGEKHVLQHYCVDSRCLVTTSVCTHQQSLTSLTVIVNLIQRVLYSCHRCARRLFATWTRHRLEVSSRGFSCFPLASSPGSS